MQVTSVFLGCYRAGILPNGRSSWTSSSTAHDSFLIRSMLVELISGGLSAFRAFQSVQLIHQRLILEVFMHVVGIRFSSDLMLFVKQRI